MKVPQGKVPLLKGAPALLAAAVLLSACPTGLAIDWDPHTAIEEVEIQSPDPNTPQVWLAGSDHSLTCSTSSDTDRCRPNAEAEWQDIADSVTHYWTGTGTFKDNDNIGTSVTYICTNTAGNNSVTVYADDNYAPDNNTAIVDETAKSDSETVSVVIPTLEWVEFGGTNKHTLYKKDANPWDIGNENYASDYTTAVPNKAWVRDPALTDPVCYTKASTGGQVTASINLATSSAVTESSTVDISCNDGVPNIFTSNGVTVNAAAVTVSAMNHATGLVNTVGGWNWQIAWSYKVPSMVALR